MSNFAQRGMRATEKSKRGIGAVSYTHLDVYKRQIVRGLSSLSGTRPGKYLKWRVAEIRPSDASGVCLFRGGSFLYGSDAKRNLSLCHDGAGRATISTNLHRCQTGYVDDRSGGF